MAPKVFSPFALASLIVVKKMFGKLTHYDIPLTTWEKKFLEGIKTRPTLTPKQNACLTDLYYRYFNLSGKPKTYTGATYQTTFRVQNQGD